MSNDHQPQRTIYLLHFDQPVGRASHYIGITRSDRLEARMQEHCGEHASSLTARAARQATAFTQARLWHGATFDQEKRLKHAGHYEKLCPICRGKLDLTGARRRYSPRSIEDQATAWRPVGPETSSSNRPEP